MRKVLREDCGGFRILGTVYTRGRHGTGTVSRKIFSPRDRVPEFFSPRDGPPKLSPGIPRPANLSPGPSPRSRIFQFWVPVPIPNPGFSDFASRSQSQIFCGIPQIPAVPFDPVPDADPWL